MDSRAFGRLRVAVAVLGLLAASIGGAFVFGLVGAPVVVGTENRFGAVSDENTIIETDLFVENPNPIGVRLGDTTVNYSVTMNDVDMANGSKEGLEVEAGRSTLDFSTRMRNERIPEWWVTHIRNNETTDVAVDARIQTSVLGRRSFDLQQEQQVETDIIGAFASNETRPVDGPSSPLYSNPVLYINRTDAAWGSVTEAETPIQTEFVVYNPQLKPYAITEVGYVITMNGVEVGSGTSDRTYVIPGGATETLRATTSIQNDKLDDWWVTHLERNQVTDLRIDFYAKVELPTGNEVRVPLDRLTYETTIETDIFGTKNETDAAGSAGTGTPTAGGNGATETVVDTVTAEPTSTPTPTDDGGLLG
jgi:LEA14-like dessication related protein